MARAGERHETIGAGPAGYEAELADLADATPETVAGYLTAHSGLPGPRANLALADAFAAVAPADLVRQFVGSPDEFLAFCATEALGRLCLSPADRTGALVELRRAAADPRWRVREGAARALQLLGDADPDLLYPVIDEWAGAADPWLARAAVAAICEPRLLHETPAQELALHACDRATALLLGAPLPAQASAADREAHRVLRLALGYTWSVAIAASPEAGLAAFRSLAAREEPDARWIVRSNLTKKRLRSVVTERNLWGLFG